MQKITHDFSFRHLGWWLDHKWSNQLCFPWHLVLFSLLGFKVDFSSGSCTWSRNMLPSLWFIALAPPPCVCESPLGLVVELESLSKTGAKALNGDDGSMFLDHVYDPLLKPTLNPRSENNTKRCRKRSGPDHLWSSHQPRWRKLKSWVIFWICRTDLFHISLLYNPTNASI